MDKQEAKDQEEARYLHEQTVGAIAMLKAGKSRLLDLKLDISLQIGTGAADEVDLALKDVFSALDRLANVRDSLLKDIDPQWKPLPKDRTDWYPHHCGIKHF